MSEKYNELPIAAHLLEPGNSKEYKTGGWRAQKPVHNPEKCLWIKNGTCGRCWIFCPDMSVELTETDGKYLYAYNYDYCKGCGICARECPTQSIQMESEDK